MKQCELMKLVAKIDKRDVYFGPQGFAVVKGDEDFAKAQIGFSIDEVGTDLSGNGQGDWQPFWQVIALDTELGDPYFVDTSDDMYPVYTAMQGDAGWEFLPVATSMSSFFNCLSLLSKCGEQQSPLFVPDETTIIEKSVIEALQLSLIKESNAVAFWSDFFHCYFDWLEDED